MRYIYFKNTLDEGIVYVEVDNEGYAWRQILKKDDVYIASNRKHEKYLFFLSDQPIQIDEHQEMMQMTQDEFEDIWNEYLEKMKPEWEKIKSEFPTGRQIEGVIEVFYAQGLIVNLCLESVFGVVDYEEIKNNFNDKDLYPGDRIRGKVKGYDEKNVWIVVGGRS